MVQLPSPRPAQLAHSRFQPRLQGEFHSNYSDPETWASARISADLGVGYGFGGTAGFGIDSHRNACSFRLDGSDFGGNMGMPEGGFAPPMDWRGGSVAGTRHHLLAAP